MSLSPAAAAFFSEHHTAWVRGGSTRGASFNLFSEDERSLWDELEAASLARRADADGRAWQLTDAGERGT